MPRCVISELQLSLEKWASDPTSSYETDEIFGKRQEHNRAKIAQILGVQKNNITLTDNTTMGLSMTLHGLNFSSTDKVIITNHEHNAIVSPLTILQQRFGTSIIKRNFPSVSELIKMDAEQLIEHLFPNTDSLKGAKALCVSHIYPTTGVRLSLKLLRKKVNQLGIKYLIVDGAQAFGMLDGIGMNENLSHCDFYAAPGHKWLNGPPSTGLLYLKNVAIKPPEFFPIGSQRMTQYKNKTSDFPMAKALQVRGCSNAVGFNAMITAMEFVNQSGGFKAVERHILKLSKSMRSFLVKIAPLSLVSPAKDKSLTSGMTVFYPFSWDKPQKLYSDKSTAEYVVAELLKVNIQIRSISFDNNGDEQYVLRVSTGHFNGDADLFSLQSALEKVLKTI